MNGQHTTPPAFFSQDFSTGSVPKVDALFLGPHPDDIELFAGGLAAKLSGLGHRVGLCDLTKGEMGSLGDVSLRKAECERATLVLGALWRVNLEYPDCGLQGLVSSGPRESILAPIIRLLRECKPDLLVLPYWEDRHPDHGASSRLASEAVFLANLKNFAPNLGPSHQVLQSLYYPTRTEVEASFIVDISGVYPQKMQAIEAYSSQVRPQGLAPGVAVPLVGSALSLSSLQARDAYFGGLIAAAYGEAYLSKSAIPIQDPIAYFRKERTASPLFFLR